MAETFNRLKIEINQPVTDIITAVQDDTNSRYLDVFIYDNGTPIDLTGHEVRIFVEKPATNGEQFTVWNNGEITDAAAGRCQFLLTTQMLAEVGYLNVQISIWLDNTEILSTEVFHMFVTESLRSDGSIESSNEYGALVVLFQNLYESIDLMTTMVQNYGSAGEVAEQIPATTFWQMLESVYSMCKDAYENASVAQVLTELGNTADTGATDTTGTVYGKLNDILTKTQGLNSTIGTPSFMPLDDIVNATDSLVGLKYEHYTVTCDTSIADRQTFTIPFSAGKKKVILATVAAPKASSNVDRIAVRDATITIDGIAYSSGGLAHYLLFSTSDTTAYHLFAIYICAPAITGTNEYIVSTDTVAYSTDLAPGRRYLNFFVESSLEVSVVLQRLNSNATSNGSITVGFYYIPLD